MRGTHILEVAPEKTIQDTERMPPCEGHLPPRDRNRRGWSGHGKKRPRRALTSWRPHRKGQVRTRKECYRAKSSHILEAPSQRTIQHTKWMRPREGHSQTVDRVGRNKSGHGNSETYLVHSHPGERIGTTKFGHRNSVTEKGALTFRGAN